MDISLSDPIVEDEQLETGLHFEQDTGTLLHSDKHLNDLLTQENYVEKDDEGNAVNCDGSNLQPITVDGALTYFRSQLSPSINEKDNNGRPKILELLRWWKISPKLNESLMTEIQLVHYLMECRLDWNDNIHWRMLQSIYSNLTSSQMPCPQKGSHWQLIGFQGNDPSTDLRRVGLFGLVQLVHLVSADLLAFGRLVYSVANSPQQPFPLAVLSINVTNITINAMESGKLTREFNIHNAVIDVLNQYYVALLVYVLDVWTSQHKTIKDSGYLLKEAEKYCGKNIKKVLKEFPPMAAENSAFLRQLSSIAVQNDVTINS